MRQNYDFGFFQETLISDQKSIASLSARWPGKCFWSPAIGKQGGVLVLINDRCDCEVLSWKRDSSGRLISLLVGFNHSKINLLCIYAPTNLAERREFFSGLHEFFIPADDLLLGGDFNCYDSTLDKLGGNININNEFQELKSTFRLVDVWRRSHPATREFTWFNSDFSIASRLDKFYLSSNVAKLFLSSSITPCYSDHDYVNLHLDFSLLSPRGPGIWNFNNSLLDDPAFCDYISSRITDLSSSINCFESLLLWWDFFKESIKSDCISFASKKRAELSHEVVLTNRLINCKQSLVQGDSSICPEIISLEAQLAALTRAEIEGVKMRSRIRWLEEGEKPTRFFFKLEQERAEKHRVSAVYDCDGNEVTSRTDLENAHVNFYRRLFACEEVDPVCQQHLFSQVDLKLSSEESASCEGPASLEELTTAVKSLTLNKSPGPDGLSLEFYLCFWNILGPLLCRLFKQCLLSESLPESLRTSVTRLLFKKRGDVKDLKNWRPISLLNVDYKILSKVITLRLSRVMESIVHPDQTCSVPGRSITSNVIMLRDVLDYINRTNESGILVSLDQEKAFDRVNHSFLLKLLSHLGFGACFIKWVSTLYNGANMKIILNGYLTEKIEIRRGVRQGDPLSPLLYVLCVEVLASLIRTSSFITGFLLPGAKGLHFRVRQYADDTTTFVKNIPSLIQLFNIISLYEKGSGAKLNRSKTEAMWLGAWKSREDQPLGLCWVQKMKILGVWFGVVPVEEDNWLPRINKLEKSINLWKSRSLSLIGKSLVINIIGLSKFYYLARVLTLPEWVIRKINHIIWPFLWGSKIETVARSSLSCNVLEGGLGIVNLPLKCDSLRVSALFTTIGNPEDKSYFLCKYFVGWHLARFDPKWLSLRDNSSPSSFEPTPFYSSCLSVMSRFDVINTPPSCKAIYCALNKLSSPPSLHRAWVPYLGPRFPIRDYWAKVRDSFCDNRLNDLFWLIALRGVKIRDSLYKWGYIPSYKCAVCDRRETTDHCFLNCSRVKKVWTHFRPILSALLDFDFLVNVCTVFFFCFNTDAKKARIASFVIKNVTYAVWTFRNKSTFHNGREDASVLIKYALHSIKGRVKLDFYRLPREKFLRVWSDPSFCLVRNDTLFFCF